MSPESGEPGVARMRIRMKRHRGGAPPPMVLPIDGVQAIESRARPIFVPYVRAESSGAQRRERTNAQVTAGVSCSGRPQKPAGTLCKALYRSSILLAASSAPDLYHRR